MTTQLSMKKPQAAKALGISVDSFRSLVRRGILPQPVDMGGIEVWLVRDLQEALDRLKRSPDRDPVMEAATGGFGGGAQETAHG